MNHLRQQTAIITLILNSDIFLLLLLSRTSARLFISIGGDKNDAGQSH